MVPPSWEGAIWPMRATGFCTWVFMVDFGARSFPLVIIPGQLWSPRLAPPPSTHLTAFWSRAGLLKKMDQHPYLAGPVPHQRQYW
ncbi:hypothetical protein B0H66DRAFT_546199 [Apodospora peruviana]|uniref:Uncharacterized protein n=1 Tax=Apodospora peruviana TaxID=516989 RepID=A0AAE0MGW8_9PEZI|nr:hypothetical protein B0H66DRAFT_546199 [Apodospora peruviana]